MSRLSLPFTSSVPQRSCWTWSCAPRLAIQLSTSRDRVASEPRDAVRARLVDNWIAKRGAQLHVQHERWGTDEVKGRDKRDI